LFGYTAKSSEYAFYTVFYDDTSVTPHGLSGLRSGYNKDIFFDPDGCIYSSQGEVLDVRDPLAPALVGRFASSGAALPLPGATALMVSGSGLLKLDTTTLSQVDARATGCDGNEYTTGLMRIGSGRVAFINYSPVSPESGVVCIVTAPGLIP
jgi:hypothetical protein